MPSDVPTWCRWREGESAVLLIAPHGGVATADLLGAGGAARRGNDLHTAELARRIGERLDASWIVNPEMDRNELDLNRVRDVLARAPWFVASVEHLLGRILERHEEAVVLILHGWHVGQPRCDLGIGVSLQGPESHDVDARALTVSREFLAGALEQYRLGLEARGVLATYGERWPAAHANNVMRFFRRGAPHRAASGIARWVRDGRVQAVQLELGAPLRWPGPLRDELVAWTATAFRGDGARRGARAASTAAAPRLAPGPRHAPEPGQASERGQTPERGLASERGQAPERGLASERGRAPKPRQAPEPGHEPEHGSVPKPDRAPEHGRAPRSPSEPSLVLRAFDVRAGADGLALVAGATRLPNGDVGARLMLFPGGTRMGIFTGHGRDAAELAVPGFRFERSRRGFVLHFRGHLLLVEDGALYFRDEAAQAAAALVPAEAELAYREVAPGFGIARGTVRIDGEERELLAGGFADGGRGIGRSRTGVRLVATLGPGRAVRAEIRGADPASALQATSAPGGSHGSSPAVRTSASAAARARRSTGTRCEVARLAGGAFEAVPRALARRDEATGAVHLDLGDGRSLTARVRSRVALLRPVGGAVLRFTLGPAWVEADGVAAGAAFYEEASLV